MSNVTFSKHSCPIAFGSTRTSNTTELGKLIRHHIFPKIRPNVKKDNGDLTLADANGIGDRNTRAYHFTKSRNSPEFKTRRLFDRRLFAHFRTTSILHGSCGPNEIETAARRFCPCAAISRAGRSSDRRKQLCLIYL